MTMNSADAQGKEIVIVATGTANIASVQAALRRLGCEPELSADPQRIEQAAYVVLPGVGAFAAAMKNLEEASLVDPLRRRIAAGRPTLCICLGLQLLAQASAESPGVTGLGVVPARVQGLAEGVEGGLCVPQMGWNQVVVQGETQMLNSGYAYFANSFGIPAAEYGQALRSAGFRLATTHYGREFITAFEREGLLACQFHPELSGPWGHALLGRWLERSAQLLGSANDRNQESSRC
jgi:imidazole glycerol phosphate synthase glutamine amidotransferase subunit